MLTVLVKILGIFAIIVVGYIATKLKVLSHEAEPAMVNLLIMITTPCMIFSSIVTKELDDSISGKVTLILISAFAYFIIIGYGIVFSVIGNENEGTFIGGIAFCICSFDIC